MFFCVSSEDRFGFVAVFAAEKLKPELARRRDN